MYLLQVKKYTFSGKIFVNCILDGLIIILRDISKKYEESY